jgi:prefoldin subunit 5
MGSNYLWIMQGNRMNLDGLTPDQQNAIKELAKKIELLESKLAVLQARMARIDPKLMANLARNFKHINLN